MPDRALKYVEKHGITTEAKYPYRGVQGKCQSNTGEYKTKGHKQLAANESSMKAALQTTTISIALDATNFQYYNPNVKKIFSNCGNEINHGVLIVGYDEQSTIVKNSWGPDWGVNGYIHLKSGNTCAAYEVMVVVSA
jgi:C1A family cysteine protease